MTADGFNPFSLEGKTVLVTGASSGIGRGIAVACRRMGAQVFATGRNEERLAATLDEMQGEGRVLAADLAKEGDVCALVDALPALDGVVHCAGVGQRQPCRMIRAADIDRVMDANFKATVLLQTQLVSKRKVKKGASVVFIASRAAFAPSVGNAVYSASKGALVAYAKCLALEVAGRMVRVNCICPGMVWTGLIREGGLSDEDLREAQERYPLKRFGRPEDVAHLCVYLLSDAAAWMTGSCIDISGGGEGLLTL